MEAARRDPPSVTLSGQAWDHLATDKRALLGLHSLSIRVIAAQYAPLANDCVLLGMAERRGLSSRPVFRVARSRSADGLVGLRLNSLPGHRFWSVNTDRVIRNCGARPSFTVPRVRV